MGNFEFACFLRIMNQEKSPRRVLFLFAHLHKGGMQRAVSNISLALPSGFEQYIGFFGTENPSFEYCATLHNFNVPGSLDAGFLLKGRNLFLRLCKLRRFVREKKIDVVVSFGEIANILNMMSLNSAYRILSVRSVIGSYGDTNLYNRIYRRLIHWVYPFADAIVAVSADLKDQTEKIVRKMAPVRQIPNLYHLTKIKALAAEPLPNELGYLAKSRFILNVGALVNEKGQNLLIRVFAAISDGFPDLWLVIVGRGQEKTKYIAEAERLGVASRVVIIDFDSNPYKYMRCATIFVLPSLTEGFPNVLIEAMACGCPVVAFDCPTGPREILGTSEYGELVEHMNLEALAERINKLLSSDERLSHLKEQGATRATHYDANRIVEQWVNILTEH